MNFRGLYITVPITLFFTLFLFLTSCQIGYIVKSAKNQFSMMSDRQPINKVLAEEKLNSEQKNKLILTQQARDFAFNHLKLYPTENYNTYIDLKRPFVTWVVNAAYKWEMKNYNWSYPFFGQAPYKGFFSEAEAEEEASELAAADYDVFIRGVSAYSTLGWFKDSVLSSMLRYKEHDLVNTIIHEIVHTTLYIKSNADFNERLAVFIGNKGTEMFYHQLEGPQSETVKLIQLENADDQLFSKFISKEIKLLETWYNQKTTRDEILRQDRLNQIKKNFALEVKPYLKTKSYQNFEKQKLNNATLGLYKTYMEDLSDFEKVYELTEKNIPLFIEKMKTLENSKDPVADLKKMASDQIKN